MQYRDQPDIDRRAKQALTACRDHFDSLSAEQNDSRSEADNQNDEGDHDADNEQTIPADVQPSLQGSENGVNGITDTAGNIIEQPAEPIKPEQDEGGSLLMLG